MKIIFRINSKFGRSLGRLLCTGLFVGGLGIASMPAQAAVTVDQSPLIVQASLPPNITLMLDDSGSMAYDYMPDACYLDGVVCTGTNNGSYNGRGVDTISTTSNNALIASSNNGVYYNPAVTYAPPPKADSTTTNPDIYHSYSDITNVPLDGFSLAKYVDLTNYSSSLLTGENNNQTKSLNYSVSLNVSKILSQTVTATGGLFGVTAPQACSNLFNNTNGISGSYKSSYYVAANPATNPASGTCSFPYTGPAPYFQYSTGPVGSYVVNYVSASSSCNGQSNCTLASDTSGIAAPKNVMAGQNIANWFAYYHTRILLAKSGIMSSFSGIDATYRIGFGSIDGGSNNNYKNLSTSRYSYSDGYNGGQNYIANIVPFGNGSSSSDQKSTLWNWAAKVTPSGGTPLRQALGAVGAYYQTDQPWQTSATDLTELACRQSYTILTTDGFWNDSDPAVGNADATKTTVTGPNNQTYTYTAAPPYSDSQSNTLADVAMYYWQTDLMATGSKNIANEVPTSAEDPAFWQHMATFTVGLGFTPSGISPTGTTINQIAAWANGGSAISNFSWPAPASNSLNNIADLAHAAINGHGGFYSATSPDAFTSGLKDALKRASERVGTGSSLAANSTQLSTGTFAYQANYYTAKWKGDLKAIVLDPNTGALAATPTWTASTVLPAFASRMIYTYNTDVSPASAVLFSSPTGLSAAEDAALGGTATAQQSMINYLRGDSSLEQKNTGGTYRNRDTPLGDIVDSQPIYVGQPDVNQFSGQTFSGSTTYAAYANTARTGLIYVAANDGMLHAFNASTGAETFAYIPAAVITSGLSTLANTDYGATNAVPHQYFNDGELTVADVYFSSAWHSVAVGTTGRGTAKAVYALDVTNPSSISLLWERSAGDGNTNAGYIGQMTGKPVIAQVADGSWSVVMGNGYNSANGVAALLQFGIADGSLTVHLTDSATSNGLAAPGVWIGDQTNGISTIAYAGDVQGREWSFVMNNGTASQPSSSGTKLFTASVSAGTIQPITAGTLLGKDPATGNLWIFLGTGQYLSTSDLATTTTQSWYGLIVQSATSGIALDGSQDRSKLVQRSIVAETAGTAAVLNPDGSVKTAAIAPARAITAAPTTPDMTGKSGWYIDLLSPTSSTNGTTGNVTYTPNQVAQGERIVTPNLFQGNQLIATTRIPQATDLCNPSGRGWIMSVNPFTGTAPSSSFFDLNGDGQINQPADSILVNGSYVPSSGIGFSSLPNNPIFVGGSMLVSFDNGSASSIKTSGSGAAVNRVSWRELINQ